MIGQVTHTFQVFRRVVQFSVVEPQRCAIERGADAEELALLEALQYLHFFAVLPDSPGGAGVSLQDRTQMRFAATDEGRGMRGFYRELDVGDADAQEALLRGRVRLSNVLCWMAIHCA